MDSTSNSLAIKLYHSYATSIDIDLHTHSRWDEHELLAHFKPERTKEIISELLSLNKTNEKISQVKMQCEDFHLFDDFLQKDVFDLYALRAVVENKISTDDFCTLMLFKSALKEPNVAIDKIICHPCSDPKFKEALLFQSSYSPMSLVEEDVDKIISKLDTLSHLSQHFLLLPVDDEQLEEMTVTKRIYNVGFNVFNYVKLTGSSQLYAVVVSLPLMRATLEILFEDQAMQMHPVLAISSLDNMFDDEIANLRPFFIPSSLFPTPEEADKFVASGLKFSKHDWYHIFVASSAPKKHRDLILKLSNLFKEMSKFYKVGSILLSYTRILKFKMIDLEVNSYYKSPGPQQSLMYFLVNSVNQCALEIVMNMNKKTPSRQTPLQETYRVNQVIYQSTVIAKLNDALKSSETFVRDEIQELAKDYENLFMEIIPEYIKEIFCDRLPIKRLEIGFPQTDEILGPSCFQKYLEFVEIYARAETQNIIQQCETSPTAIQLNNCNFGEPFYFEYFLGSEITDSPTLFYKSMLFLKYESISASQFNTIHIWRLMSADLAEHNTTKLERVLCVELFLQRETGEWTYNDIFRDMLSDLLSSITNDFTETDFEFIYTRMFTTCIENGIGSEMESYLVPYSETNSVENNNLSPFVNKWSKFAWEGKTYHFIPTFTLLEAIYCWIKRSRLSTLESSSYLTLIPPNSTDRVSMEYFRSLDPSNSFLPILGTLEDLEEMSVINGVQHSPLQYLFHHFEQTLIGNSYH